MNTPKNYHEVLELAKKADIVCWYGPHRHLSLTLDNVPGDRRTCIYVRMDRHNLNLTTVCDYDAVKKCWHRHCKPYVDAPLDDRRGLKSLRDWLRAMATQELGYANPTALNLYRKNGELKAL